MQTTGLKPFYGLFLFASDGTFTITENIANGNNQAETGVNLQFNVNQGQYQCLSGNRVRATSLGYTFKSDSLPFLQENGALAVHVYECTFADNTYQRGSGVLTAAFYRTGSNPLNASNPALTPVAASNITCEHINIKDFQWPT